MQKLHEITNSFRNFIIEGPILTVDQGILPISPFVKGLRGSLESSNETHVSKENPIT